MSICYESGSSSLDCFYFIFICRGIRIPYAGGVLKGWSYKSFVGVGFDLLRWDSQVPSDESEGGVSFFTNIVYVAIPAEIICDGDS